MPRKYPPLKLRETLAILRSLGFDEKVLWVRIINTLV